MEVQEFTDASLTRSKQAMKTIGWLLDAWAKNANHLFVQSIWARGTVISLLFIH
jgi:hypothetical protein